MHNKTNGGVFVLILSVCALALTVITMTEAADNTTTFKVLDKAEHETLYNQCIGVPPVCTTYPITTYTVTGKYDGGLTKTYKINARDFQQVEVGHWYEFEVKGLFKKREIIRIAE